MRALKFTLFIAVVLSAIVALAVPLVWFNTASNLPNPIESAADIETLLRSSIQSERQSVQYNKRLKDRQDVSWPKPDFSKLPKLLVALYVTETGCPTYFDTPSETGLAWNKRLASSLLGGMPDGDGACELIFAHRLAKKLGAKSPLQVAVASDRIHSFLKKDELVAFDLHSADFEHGLIGVEAAAPVLLQRELLEMNLAELAEFQLGIPPHGYWEDVKQCKNAALVRQSRDTVLEHLWRYGHVTETAAKTAQTQAPRCLSVQR